MASTVFAILSLVGSLGIPSNTNNFSQCVLSISTIESAIPVLRIAVSVIKQAFFNDRTDPKPKEDESIPLSKEVDLHIEALVDDVSGLNPDDIDGETITSIWERWQSQAKQIEALGIDMQRLINQSLITPSCGIGSLGLDYVEKVISLTKAVSRKVRNLKFAA